MAAASSRVPIPKNGVDYRGCIVLAPMVRSGELPSRLMALRYGADLVWGKQPLLPIRECDLLIVVMYKVLKQLIGL